MYLLYKTELLKIVRSLEVPNTSVDIFFSIFPKLIEIESKKTSKKPPRYSKNLQKYFLHVFPTQTQWEIRKIHGSVQALLQDLSPRTGRSILYELTDYELSQLLQQVKTALQKRLSYYRKRSLDHLERHEVVRKEASQNNVRLPSFII